MRRGVAWVVLLALLVPLAVGQGSTPVLVAREDEGGLSADVGESAVARFSIANLNPSVGFHVTIVVDAPEEWDALVEAPGDRDARRARAEILLAPGEAEELAPVLVNVTFRPVETPREGIVAKVVFTMVHRESGAVTRQVEDVAVASGAPPKVLGLFENPLPSPLDNAYGTFLLEAAFWVLVALGAILVGDTVVRGLTARASNVVTREILTKLRRPIFYLVFALGVARSFAVLPDNPFTEFVRRTFLAIAIGIFGLYVVYRVLDAILLYYHREISPRTDNTVDDVLVPVVRRMGLVVLWVVGAILTLRTLGWDPTILFAGAGIAGLVVAFAAQDSLSNLFSGLFLLVDQPFREGDPITIESGELAEVRSIGLRTTHLYNWRTHETIIVPNNQLATRRIINHQGPDPRCWLWLDVGVAYGSNVEHVRRLLLRVAREHPLVLKEGEWEPNVILKGFGESSVDMTLRVGVPSFRGRTQIGSDLRFAIRAAFEAEGIEIPFPQRTVWVRQAPADGSAPRAP